MKQTALPLGSLCSRKRINNLVDRNEWCGEAWNTSFKKKLLGATPMEERFTQEDLNERMKCQKILKESRERVR